MTAYYNEIEPFAAEWIRNLIAKGLIAPGDVDTRSIVDVRPDDLRGYTQCHFFAGIGGWSYALRSAGWDDARPVWTGSCPCQPFSLAGKQKGFDDVRHLWPVWRELIRECDPAVVFGEQVASAGKWPGDLQRMRDREAIERVLQGQSFDNGPAINLQGLLEDEARRASEEESSADPLHLGEAESGTEGPDLRLGSAHRRPASRDRGGQLPIDWGSIQPGRRNDLGQPITGPDRLEEGLRAQQHPSGALLGQRDGEPLGAEQDHRDSPSDQGAKVVPVGRPTGEVGSSAAQESNWLRSVRSDLEAMGRAVGAMPIQAASAGADHLRDRYWFVAYRESQRLDGGQNTSWTPGRVGSEADGVADAARDDEQRNRQSDEGCEPQISVGGLRAAGDLAEPYGARRCGRDSGAISRAAGGDPSSSPNEGNGDALGDSCASSDVADASGGRLRGPGQRQGEQSGRTEVERPSNAGDMADSQRDERARERLPEQQERDHADTLGCDGSSELSWVVGADGKARRVKPGLRLLAHGVSGRVGKLRGFGNAIDPRPAKEFIGAFIEIAETAHLSQSLLPPSETAQ